EGRPALPILLQEIRRCQEQLTGSRARWREDTLVTVITDAMKTLPKVAAPDPQVVKTITDLTKFSTPNLVFDGHKNTNTPFRDEGARLLGDLAEGQPEHRKQIIPALTALLKESVQNTNATQDAAVLHAIQEVDLVGNALMKCGPEAKPTLAKEVVPRLKDLEFHRSKEVRT